jgi:hypothetical protein
MPRYRRQYHEDDVVSGYCIQCARDATETPVDFGIGSYEYWGAKGTHEDVQLVSECCEAEVVKHLYDTEPFQQYFDDPNEPDDEDEIYMKMATDIAKEDNIPIHKAWFSMPEDLKSLLPGAKANPGNESIVDPKQIAKMISEDPNDA